MTKPALQVDVTANEAALTSGGITLKTNSDGNLYLFDTDGKEIADIVARTEAIEKVSQAFPMFGTALQNEATKLQKAIAVMTTMSGKATAAFGVANDNKQAYQLGDRMPDTSYYMGVSEDTGTDFFLFIESAGTSKTADVVTFNKGTEILHKKNDNKETFHGHTFSKFQLEDEITKSYANNTADGGNRRLTKKEWAQVEKVFQAKPDLREAALEVCAKDNWVLSASPYDDNGAWFQNLSDGGQSYYYRGTDASLLVGRSLPRP